MFTQGLVYRVTWRSTDFPSRTWHSGTTADPVQPFDRDVLADSAGHDVMPLDAKARDRLHRVEAHGPLGPAVVLSVAMGVAVQPQGRAARLGHRRLRDAAERG